MLGMATRKRQGGQRGGPHSCPCNFGGGWERENRGGPRQGHLAFLVNFQVQKLNLRFLDMSFLFAKLGLLH